ncbi:hypothetical protein [Treponema sp. C6A8]|uniref:hypothetical protein n=1 Tax=Treponema sp. C6A8 TaxID=1410609 RepID=UPI000487EE8E|nr:hypothetical protein [Treponema sp. C6A8]
MKKFFLAIGLMFASVCAFANIELDVNMYGTIAKAMATESTDDDAIGGKLKVNYTQPFAFGFEDNVNFFFGNKASKFDAGLALFINCDFFNKIEYKPESGEKDSMSGTGCNVGFGIGPVFRITFANPFSLFIRPTLGFNLFVFESEDYKNTDGSSFKRTIAEFDLFKFDVNVGGRSWLLNVDGFHLGIDYGAIIGLGAGFGGTGSKGSSSSSNTNAFAAGDVDFKLYLGCCMNFGDRGFDR